MPACEPRRQQARGRRGERSRRAPARPARPPPAASCLSSTRSGALSCTKLGAGDRLLRRVDDRPAGPRPAAARASAARRRAARCRASRRPCAPRRGRGRRARTSMPLSRKRAAQPPPITPPPSSPTVRGGARAHAGRAAAAARAPRPGPRTRTFIASRMRDGALDELRRWSPSTPRDEVEVVLQPDAHVAARQRRHARRTGSCMRPIEKAEKTAPGRQLVDHREQRRRDRPARRRGCPCRAGSARGSSIRPSRDQLLDDHQVAGVEDLELRPHAELLDARAPSPAASPAC